MIDHIKDWMSTLKGGPHRPGPVEIPFQRYLWQVSLANHSFCGRAICYAWWSWWHVMAMWRTYPQDFSQSLSHCKTCRTFMGNSSHAHKKDWQLRWNPRKSYEQLGKALFSKLLTPKNGGYISYMSDFRGRLRPWLIELQMLQVHYVNEEYDEALQNYTQAISLQDLEKPGDLWACQVAWCHSKWRKNRWT